MKERMDKMDLIVTIQELSNQLQIFLEEENKTKNLCSEFENTFEYVAKEVLLDLSCDLYWEYNPILKRIKFSKPFLKDEDKFQDHELRFQEFLAVIPKVQQKKLEHCFNNLMQKESKVEEFEYQYQHKDGSWDWYYAKSSVLLDQDNNVVRIIGINRNITSRKAESERIEQEQAKNEMLISFANNFIWEYDCDEDSFTANHSLSDKLGLEHRSYTYEEISKIHHVDTPLCLKGIVDKPCISGHSRVQLYSERDQGYLIFDVNYGGLRTHNGSVYRFIGTLDDITERELLMATAARDPLTNVYNRRMGGLRLRSSFQKYREQGEFYTIAFFDVDEFKYVNDKFGHDMGDFVLKAVCDTITKEIRNSDMLFRWGGDELLLICSGISKENIYANIDRIRTIIENEKFEYNGEKIHLTVSIGAAYFYKNDIDEKQAVKRADRSLYKAKLAGRNKVCILL